MATPGPSTKLLGRPNERRLHPLVIALAVLVAWGAYGASPPAVAAQGSPGPAVSPAPRSPIVGMVVQDGQPVAGSVVTLHRITSENSGEVGSIVTDSTGKFQFLPEPIPGGASTLYIATADYRSVRFFGPVMRAEDAGEEYILAVYDTASVLSEPVRVVSRDVVLLPGLDGSWEVDEIVGILNPTSQALVSPEGGSSWQFSLPSGVVDFVAGTGVGGPTDILPHELRWSDDRVMVVTPLTPGYRDAYVRYRLPPGPAESILQVDELTDTLSIYVPQPSHLTSVSGMQSTRIVEVDSLQYLQYRVTDLEPGAQIELRWGRAGGPPVDPIITAVVITLLFLAAGVWAAMRNRPTGVA